MMMSSSPPHSEKWTFMARSPRTSMIADGLVFAGGAAVALLLFWAFVSILGPSTTSSTSFSLLPERSDHCVVGPHKEPTFYDDPSLTYTVDGPLRDWDAKRRHWLRVHGCGGGNERVLMVTGSQSGPCRNPVGDHLLLRFYKNKADYCRLHGIELFYNMALLHPQMFAYWAKIPLIRAAMVAHPEAEWIWWVDSDAAFTDMDFSLPLEQYKDHNLIVHGWPRLVYKEKSWTSLNAGVFLIRNCQWSLDFMAVWARMGPQSPEYDSWGKTLKSEFKNKIFPESDDQSGLVYLLLKEKEKWGDKIYLENKYYFEGYWVEIVGRLENMTERYLEMERRAPELRRRRAEAAAEDYGRMREVMMRAEGGWRTGREGWRRPFITHFTGCQPCSGDHNGIYSGENCWDGMQRALNFADDQVLRAYGFRHPGLLNTSEVTPLLFDFPAAPEGE